MELTSWCRIHAISWASLYTRIQSELSGEDWKDSILTKNVIKESNQELPKRIKLHDKNTDGLGDKAV